MTKGFNFNSPLLRLLAFWFGIGWLYEGIRALLDGWKEGGRLDDPVGVMVVILFGAFLTAFAVGGQKLVDKILAKLKNFGS